MVESMKMNGDKFDDEIKRNVLSKYFAWLAPGEDVLPLFSKEERNWIVDTLLRKEEFDLNHRDQWGNWDFNFTKEDYKVPYVDMFVTRRIKEKGVSRKSIWPNEKKFAFWLTHDLDVVSSADPKMLNRMQLKLAMNSEDKTQKLLQGIHASYNFLRKLKPYTQDPLWVYEKWVDLEKEFGFDSTFFVFSRPSNEKDVHVYDCDFVFDDRMKYRGRSCSVAEYILQLSKEGMEVGLHGSYLSWKNSDLLSEQKRNIEGVLGKPILAARQHFLHFDIDKTPEALVRAGIKLDSTMGFNRSVGFRAGTSFPFMISNGLMEVPQIIMDGALFNDNSLDYNEQLAQLEVERILDCVEEVGGCVTINFHPNYLLNSIYWNTYKFILNALKSRNAACMNAERFLAIVQK
ncbi:MAG: polysaccharide deacetylase family protein [Bacteroidetes bacterium]|nr:polysaccharide deacetylase family protein [Bacteroidota bacterium]